MCTRIQQKRISGYRVWMWQFKWNNNCSNNNTNNNDTNDNSKNNNNTFIIIITIISTISQQVWYDCVAELPSSHMASDQVPRMRCWYSACGSKASVQSAHFFFKRISSFCVGFGTVCVSPPGTD
ncbi:unnamed protein product [Polarella glacialis]|uniref:Uncharacterized protein n=1 Tax=Polarella glacialis TaxID=89957 RepID=A0A813IR89_POLGL|nr:unnamed protein product [Polarella glacialis]